MSNCGLTNRGPVVVSQCSNCSARFTKEDRNKLASDGDGNGVVIKKDNIHVLREPKTVAQLEAGRVAGVVEDMYCLHESKTPEYKGLKELIEATEVESEYRELLERKKDIDYTASKTNEFIRNNPDDKNGFKEFKARAKLHIHGVVSELRAARHAVVRFVPFFMALGPAADYIQFKNDQKKNQ